MPRGPRNLAFLFLFCVGARNLHTVVSPPAAPFESAAVLIRSSVVHGTCQMSDILGPGTGGGEWRGEKQPSKLCGSGQSHDALGRQESHVDGVYRTRLF
jgi:hypothetical protein